MSHPHPKKSRRTHLKELDGVLSVGQQVQFGLALLQFSDFLLDFLQQLLSFTDGRLFLLFDKLSHLKALQLYLANQLCKDGVALFSCGPSRTLEGDANRATAFREGGMV